MKVHSGIHKILLLPVYYLIHYNYFFGLVHKHLFKDFNYKKLNFKLNIDNIPIQTRSSFLFKTYEYNDKKLIEKYITKKNRCIIIGGGIGFIPVLAYHKSKNKILVFEINNAIIKNLKTNLTNNKCSYKILKNNLTIKEKKKYSNFYISKNFLLSSKYLKSSENIKVKNINTNNVQGFKKFNTIIVDGEGIEEYFINNLHQLKNIDYLIFELHHNLFSENKIKKMFQQLKKNNFLKAGKCFNSFYFVRKNKNIK